MTKEKVDVQKFFTDPKHADEADFFRGAVDYLVNEKIEKAKKENPENTGVLEQIFGPLFK
jgi:hypothetical protein